MPRRHWEKMPYYLHHHFDPDHDHTKLKPRVREDGSVDHHDLGYVQNVVMDQVIAELRKVTDEAAKGLDRRFILEKPKFPAGKNTAPNPQNPAQLLSKANGYACYEDGLIRVRKVLSVPRDISFHTGNILFLGDLVVEKSVMSGFSIQARNILVKGHIGGASVVAQESISAESGIKGERSAILNAGKSIRIPFCEHAVLLAKENILINGVCMHSDLYVGKQLAVKGRLIGGAVYCRSIAYVQEQLGGGPNTLTRVILGYDPFLLRKTMEIDDQIEEQTEILDELKSKVEKFAGLEQELTPEIIATEKKLHALFGQKGRLWEAINNRESSRSCGLVVPGEVKPGVVISIGEATYDVREPMSNVRFTWREGQIVHSTPAMKTK